MPGLCRQGSQSPGSDPQQGVARLHAGQRSRDPRHRRLHERGHVRAGREKRPGHGRIQAQRLRRRVLRRHRRGLVRPRDRRRLRRREVAAEADHPRRLSQGAEGLDPGRIEHLAPRRRDGAADVGVARDGRGREEGVVRRARGGVARVFRRRHRGFDQGAAAGTRHDRARRLVRTLESISTAHAAFGGGGGKLP